MILGFGSTVTIWCFRTDLSLFLSLFWNVFYTTAGGFKTEFVVNLVISDTSCRQQLIALSVIHYLF